MSDKLKHLREQIDSLDDQLLVILRKRIDVVSKIGSYKKANGLSLLDEKRWKKVIKSRLKIAKKMNLPEEFIEKLYNLVHEYSLELEKKI